MVEYVEELPAELGVNRLVLHLERRGLFRQGRIKIEKPGPDHDVPAQIAVGERLIGFEGGYVKPLRYSPSAGDGVRIAHQVGSIGLTRVSRIAVYGNVERVSGGHSQDTAEAPATQGRVPNGIQTGTKPPSPSIGDLPNFAQHERVCELRIQQTSLLTKIRGILKRGTGSSSFRTQSSDVSQPL